MTPMPWFHPLWGSEREYARDDIGCGYSHGHGTRFGSDSGSGCAEGIGGPLGNGNGSGVAEMPTSTARSYCGQELS